MDKLTKNKQDNLTLNDFIYIVNNVDNEIFVTITYSCENIQMNIIMEDALIRQITDNEISINNYKETEFFISSDAINRIIEEGLDPIIDRIVYRIELINGIIIYVSYGGQIDV
ncbi:hypothetical protein [Clostridium sp. Marseille-P299]|uniref:hypothetical protein n=1 Tax=Clostridium sp. Marseille-P299 TaxID=1805477 RepID=UPI000836C038|nr:hypothetical protein [Clostridium sp. Marseille-P299]